MSEESSASDPRALLTVQDVAAWLRVHPKTVYGWASRQAIPTLKIQGALRFRREDLASFMEGCLVREQAHSSRPNPRRSGHHPDVPAVLARVKRLIQA